MNRPQVEKAHLRNTGSGLRRRLTRQTVLPRTIWVFGSMQAPTPLTHVIEAPNPVHAWRVHAWANLTHEEAQPYTLSASACLTSE